MLEFKKYMLDFNGRVERGSKKNFQIVDINDPLNIILQFGKRKAKNQYSMDFTFPLSPRQAFGICLSTLAGKLASH
jgi:tubby-related protein 1